jgi:endoribonuclease Dicer
LDEHQTAPQGKSWNSRSNADPYAESGLQNLSDIAEAYIGAIFVDSEFNYKEVERFFDAHIRWFFEDMSIYDTFANNHPTTYLHKLMELSFGCTNYRLMASELPAIVPGEPVTSIAVVMIHDKIICEGQASSGKNAKVKASQNALKLVKGIPSCEFKHRYGCNCEGDTKQWVGRDGDGIGMVGTAI